MTTNMFAVLVLDRSGSMSSIWEATTSAFDLWVTEQRNLDGTQAWATLVVFDDQVDVLYRAWGLADLPSLKSRPDVMPRGMTALYDAIAAGLDNADEWMRGDGSWFVGTKLCVILTDGQENHSRHETRDSIFAKIRSHEAGGWTFVYLGANQDAWEVARSMGMTNRAAVADYAATTSGTRTAVASASTGTTSIRQTGVYNPNRQQ